MHGTRLYGIWSSMVKRCECPTSSNFKYYGGRGIAVCESWRNNPKAFFDWALGNGYSDELCIDRKDVNGNYCPENCQWITHRENCLSGKRRIRHDNKTGVSGVCPTKHGTFELYITILGKQKYIGAFKTIEEAVNKKQEIEVIGNIHDAKEEIK